MEEEKINKREAYFIEALYKVHESLSLTLLSIKEHRELIDSERMDALLEPLHKLWFSGELSFLVPELNLKEQNVTQPSLFTDGLAEKSQDVTVHPPTLVFGVDVADMLTQTKKEKKK